jgi:hypothetical protein
MQQQPLLDLGSHLLLVVLLLQAWGIILLQVGVGAWVGVQQQQQQLPANQSGREVRWEAPSRPPISVLGILWARQVPLGLVLWGVLGVVGGHSMQQHPTQQQQQQQMLCRW